jgi:hypothetical protein
MSVSRILFESVDSPRSLAAYILLKNKEYAQLVNLEVDPSKYLSAQKFADDYLVSKFLSKFPDFSHEDLDPETVALNSFYEYEELCKETNKKFRELDLDPSKWDPSMQGILLLARRKIKSVLGAPNLNRIAESFGWGPGATTVARGHHTSAYVKYAQRLDVTRSSLMMGRCCVNSTPSWVNCQLQTDEFPSIGASLTDDAFNIVPGNEIVFVPKNAKTHRIIAKEPHVNSYLQKGFGSYIRHRLLVAASVDLKDQTVNQRLAKEGSLTGNLATIDLSGASDTISYELVRYLLPPEWFSLLRLIRSELGFMRKQKTWHHYHKFSSMGNACTFELESLIFWALCKACLEVNGGEQTLNVYGDDIIIPTEHYESVAKVINFVGFRVNEKKSFSSGHFRESCGKDYFQGTDVRPLFLKESISNAESLFKLANGIRRYAHRRNFDYGCDRRFRSCWSHVVSLLPDGFRSLTIPEGFGDCGLLSNFDEATPSLAGSTKNRSGWEGFVFKGLTRHPVKRGMKDRHAAYVTYLSVADKFSSTDITGLTPSRAEIVLSKGGSLPLLGHHDLRAMTFPKITRIHTHGWYDFGPWL